MACNFYFQWIHKIFTCMMMHTVNCIIHYTLLLNDVGLKQNVYCGIWSENRTRENKPKEFVIL